MARQVIIRVLRDDTLPRVRAKVRSNGTVFFHFFSRTRPNFKEVAKGM